MGFYFNTFRQEQGDKAFNEQRYENALIHYSEALKTLNLHAASNSVQHTDFYDALVYVLSEILTTKLMLIRREADDLNFGAIKNYWNDIPSLLYEMEFTHREHLTGSAHSFSNKEQVIRQVNELLANVCEEVSDALVDQLEEDDSEEANPVSPQQTLSQAIEWMNRAINFQVKTEGTPNLPSSLGYLNLLERRYKETQDETNLRVMSEYIGKYLVEVILESPLQKLELLSYVARVALFNHQDISELADECKTLYDLLPEEDRENPILDDLQNLINLIPHEDQEVENEEGLPEDMDQTSDAHSTVDLEESSAYLPDAALEGTDSNASNTAVMMDFQNLSSETTQVATPSPSGSPWIADQVMTQGTSMSQPLNTPSISRASQQGFFSVSSQAHPSEEELPHSRALQLGLGKIAADSSNPKFLANLLSLTADFFYSNRAYSIQKQNAFVLAYDLYQQVLKIDPQHQRARAKLLDLRTQHKKLIDPYKLYSNAPQSPIPTATAQISVAKNYFNQAVEELTIQLESLLMNKPAKIRVTIDQLICFIGEQLTKGAITHNPSPELEEMLTHTFEMELKNSGYSGTTLENF